MIEQVHVSGGHHEVGEAIGRRLGEQIHRFLDEYELLQTRLLPFHRTQEGQQLFRTFFRLHRTRYTHYMAELEGMARGAERPFEELLLVNLRGEYQGLLSQQGVGGCTDCFVLTPDVALLGHNEDGSPAAIGRVFLLHAQVADEPPFTALCYPGFLPGNAFGFNQNGVFHTADAVSPRRVRVGVGRHFIARSLLSAPSLDEAIRRVIVPGRSAGFTYNIGSVQERRLVSVEMAPQAHHVHEVAGHYAHTNHYLHLDQVEQRIGASSRARLERAQAMLQDDPPTDAAGLAKILGDQTDSDYPIYRRAQAPDRGTTLCSVVFDLDARQVHIFAGHPTQDTAQRLCLEL